MKKLITSILALAMLTSFAVLPSTASAESTTVFKYENNFSTYDAPGTVDGAWDMANVGKWVTVKRDYKSTWAVDQWSQDTELDGPSGSADGVLKLGDGAKPVFYFDEPVQSGNIHVGFNFYYGTVGNTRSNNMYSHFGFLNSYQGTTDETVPDQFIVYDKQTPDFDNVLIKAFIAKGLRTGNPTYFLGGLGNANYDSAGGTAMEYNQWMRIDVVMSNIESNAVKAEYYVNGEQKYETTTSAPLQPLYGFVMQTSVNFDNEFVLVDNLVIENYTGTKTVTAVADKKKLADGQNSVTFTFSDNVNTSALTKENITVTKDYVTYDDYTVTGATSKTVTISGLNDDGVYNVSFSDSISSVFGPLTTKTYIIPKGKLSNFVYKQDFSNGDTATWNNENIGKWFNSSPKDVSFAYDECEGADGKAGVMKLADSARPIFLFDKAITDGTVHLSYKIKFDQSTANYGTYHSGIINEATMTGASINGNNATINYNHANLLDTSMAARLHVPDSAFLCPGVIGSDKSNESSGVKISNSEWYKVDVILSSYADGTYFVAQYINGQLKNAQNLGILTEPFYGFIMYPFNMGTGNVYIDDLLIEHSYNAAVISDVDLSVAGKAKVTILDTSSNISAVRKVIVAGYNQNKLENVKFADFTLGRTMTSVDVDFDKTGCDEIKVFLWDSLAGLKPLANAYTQNLNN